ncbi:MAG: 4-hydroxy-tetrahydrodipicolinate synthase [Clostridiales bacterium]|nr:4-hydroxy-tetrahydrodipicolinate synthase [Clostridiales bacterium]
MANALFEGCGVALITPFENGEINYAQLDQLVDFQLQHGTDAIIACGTTGEPSTMTDAEWESVIARVVDRVNGRIPVIAGTGGNHTAEIIQKARRAKELGAQAQLCVTPYYNKTTQAGLIAHYTALADDDSLPVIVYNVPSRTGLNMQPETLAAIASHPNIIAMKEASGNMVQIMDMIRLCGDRIAFYSGSDELTAPFRAVGGKGVISVAANIAPDLMRDMSHLPIDQATALNIQALPLINALFSEVNPIPIKAAAAMLGMCKNELRLPLVPLSPANESKLREEMQKAGLLC